MRINDTVRLDHVLDYLAGTMDETSRREIDKAIRAEWAERSEERARRAR